MPAASAGRVVVRAVRRRREQQLDVGVAQQAASSALVENVLSGTLTAPMRAAASHATTNSGPFGWSTPTCVPGPAPAASSALARAADRRSASP